MSEHLEAFIEAAAHELLHTHHTVGEDGHVVSPIGESMAPMEALGRALNERIHARLREHLVAVGALPRST